ncbi:uncharacterized mitochondrial protein-like protein [Tanacetum coccineum]
MQNCNGEATPMNPGEKLQQDDGTEFADPSYYRSLVEGLNYLTNTRPDIMFSVSVLSRYLHMPTMHHLGVATRVLRYVAETYDFRIWYSRAADFNLFGYSDSDWRGCKDDGKALLAICLVSVLEQSRGALRSKK